MIRIRILFDLFWKFSLYSLNPNLIRFNRHFDGKLGVHLRASSKNWTYKFTNYELGASPLMLSSNPCITHTWWIIKFQLKWNLLDKSNLGEINENTSFQIEKDQEFSLFFRFMDSIQFSRIFHLHFFSIKNVFMVFKISEILLVGKILWEIMYHHDQITTMI
jgi:hypothetical protein